MKTNVVVGRFQTNNLHNGHLSTIREAYENLNTRNGDRLVIVVGVAPIIHRHKNPLSFEVREGMIRKSQYCWGADVLPLNDCPGNNPLWSHNLDQLLKDYPNVTLYGSRDSFIKSYNGTLPYKECKEVWHISATKTRNTLKKLNKHGNNSAFRRGIIHNAMNQYPTAFPTVDIAIVSGNRILLGRKPGRDKYCFVGGFVDPTDECLENAAARELGEEVKGITVSPMEYLSSRRIQDFRYINTEDSIMTSLFLCHYLEGDPIPADDIEEVKWFELREIDLFRNKLLSVHHHHLLDSVVAYSQNKVL